MLRILGHTLITSSCILYCIRIVDHGWETCMYTNGRPNCMRHTVPFNVSVHAAFLIMACPSLHRLNTTTHTYSRILEIVSYTTNDSYLFGFRHHTFNCRYSSISFNTTSGVSSCGQCPDTMSFFVADP